MRTVEECAKYMVKRYGKDAAIHCTYNIINNDGKNSTAVAYWRAVFELLEKPKRRRTDHEQQNS